MSVWIAFGAAQRDPREADEGGRRDHAVLDRREQLLLAASPVEIGLRRVAEVLARAGQRERLGSVDVGRPGLQPEREAAVAEAAADLRHDAASRVVDAAERVDQAREVREVHLDDVVDLDPEVLLDGPNRERRAAVGEGRVDLRRCRGPGSGRPCPGGSTAATNGRRRSGSAASRRCDSDLTWSPQPHGCPPGAGRSRARGSCWPRSAATRSR